MSDNDTSPEPEARFPRDSDERSGSRLEEVTKPTAVHGWRPGRPTSGNRPGRRCILWGTVEVGQHEDVESLGVGSRTKRVQTLAYTGFANGLGLTP